MPDTNKIEITPESLLEAIRHAMSVGRDEERRKIADEVERMIHEEMPGAYIVMLRRVRDHILIGGLEDGL